MPPIFACEVVAKDSTRRGTTDTPFRHPDAIGGMDDLAVTLAVILGAVVVAVILIPLLLFGIELILLGLVVAASIAGRGLLGRPWIIQAKRWVRSRRARRCTTVKASSASRGENPIRLDGAAELAEADAEGPTHRGPGSGLTAPACGPEASDAAHGALAALVLNQRTTLSVSQYRTDAYWVGGPPLAVQASQSPVVVRMAMSSLLWGSGWA